MSKELIKRLKEKTGLQDENTIEAIVDIATEVVNTLEKGIDEEKVSQIVEKSINAKLDSKDDRGNTMLSKMLGGSNEEEAKTKEKYSRRKSMRKFMSEGKEGLTVEEMKSLSKPINKSVMTSNDFSSGGIFANEDHIQEMEKELLNYSAVGSLVTVKNTMEKSVTYNKLPLDGRLKAYRRGELTAAKSSGKMQFVKELVPLQTATSFIQVTREDIMYSTSEDLEALIMDENTEQQAVIESYELVNGDTSKGEAEGILKNAEILAKHTVQTATTGTIDFKDINKVFVALKGPYRKNAVWAANAAGIKLLMDLTDSSGRPLLFWNKPLTEAVIGDGDARVAPTAMLHGKPLYEFPEMPDTFTTGVPMLIFGDFKAGYIIGRRNEMYMLRDENTNAIDGVVNFIFERYFGGAVKMPEAFKVLVSK